jgi:hypothetical protein
LVRSSKIYRFGLYTSVVDAFLDSPGSRMTYDVHGESGMAGRLEEAAERIERLFDFSGRKHKYRVAAIGLISCRVRLIEQNGSAAYIRTYVPA